MQQIFPENKNTDPVVAMAREVNLPWWRSAVVVVICGLAGLLCYLSPAVNKGTEAGLVAELPSTVGKAFGVEQEASMAEKIQLPQDTVIARRVYVMPSGDQILCSIVLSGGDRRSIHRPEVCLPGQGWTIKGGEIVDIPLNGGKDLKVTNLTLERELEVGPGRRHTIQSYYMYWFVGKDVVTPYHWERVFRTSYDRVTRNINHRWAYVIVSSNIGETVREGGKNREQALEMLKEFVVEVVPTCMRQPGGS